MTGADDPSTPRNELVSTCDAAYTNAITAPRRVDRCMARAPHGTAGPACEHGQAAATDGWHALLCVARSGPSINARHHAVVRLLADAAAMLKIPARVEPYNLSEDDASRPDIQLDLPKCSLLADVTISHPCAARWRTAAADRGVEDVGDARSAEKDDSYGPMATALGVRFTPFVLYTYGGFHKSALSTIEQMAAAYDPAVALVSLTAWKEELKDRIAVCVQRCTADIVIHDDRRARSAAAMSVRRRRPGRRSAAVRRPRLSERPLRRRAVEREQPALSRRAASLCAALLASVPAPSAAGVACAAAGAQPATSASAADAFIPGTPGMDVGSPEQRPADAEAAGCVRAMSALSILNVCTDACDVHMRVAELVAGVADAAAEGEVVGSMACELGV